MAEALDKLPEESGARLVSDSIRILNEAIVNVRKVKLTKSQYVMFLLADMMTWCEVGEALCHKAVNYNGKERTPEFIEAAARLFAREVAEKVYLNGLRIAHGCDQEMNGLVEKLSSLDLAQAMKSNLGDMDLVAKELVA
jgi:alkylation response protein AidB-like acyl-CoA dehydrogenase